MINILNLIILTIITYGIYFIISNSFLMFNLTHKKMDLLERGIDLSEKRMDYLLLLIDAAAEGTCSPIARAVYQKLRTLSPEEALEVAKNKNNFIREIISEGYAKTRRMLTEIRNNTDDPEKKKEYDIALEELDGIFNLLSTLDKDSNPEHVQKVMENVAISISKMREKGLDINIEGL